MAGNTSGLVLDTQLMELPLSENDRALRELFVEEYLKDFDPYQACLRVGFMSAYAKEYSARFMSESYVQQLIARKVRSNGVKELTEVDSDFALVINGLRQAAQNGPYASRVQALRALADMRGFVKKDDDNQNKQDELIEALKEFAAKAPA